MPQAVSLAEICSSAYLYADERPGGTDTVLDLPEVERLANGVLSELYELLVSAREDDGHTKTKTGATVAAQESFTLPEDFWEMRGLELNWSSNYPEDVVQIQLQERNLYRRYNTWAQDAPKGYRMMNVSGARKLTIYPTPTNVVAYTLFYVPKCPVLQNPGDMFDGVNGWAKLVSLGTAVEMRAIVQNEASDIKQLYAEQRERIEALAADREASAPKRIRNVYPEATRVPWHFRRRPTV